jgi:hypothetical protein
VEGGSVDGGVEGGEDDPSGVVVILTLLVVVVVMVVVVGDVVFIVLTSFVTEVSSTVAVGQLLAVVSLLLLSQLLVSSLPFETFIIYRKTTREKRRCRIRNRFPGRQEIFTTTTQAQKPKQEETNHKSTQQRSTVIYVYKIEIKTKYPAEEKGYIGVRWMGYRYVVE